MLIKVWSKLDREHLWAYENFKEETNVILIDYSLRGSIVESIVYSVPNKISQEVFDKYNFNYSIIDGSAKYNNEKQIYQNQNKVIQIKKYKEDKKKPLPKYINGNCYKCLFWDDEKEKCEKFGKCEFE